MTRQHAPEPEVIITAAVPGARLGWLKRELDAAGVPYQVERVGNGYHVHTREQAAPVVDGVLGYQAKGPKPARSRGIGRMVSLGLNALLPISFVIVGGAAFMAGLWEVTVLAAIGAIGQRVLGVRMENAYRAAEAVGDKAVRWWRVRDGILAIVGAAFLLAMAAFMAGVI